MTTPLYAALELGGTKTICLVGTSVDNIVDECRIPTSSPEQTLGAARDFLSQYGALAGIGIGAFGPLNVDPQSKNYGVIENTPKKNWSGTKLVNYFQNAFGCPVVVDTDVNAAGLAEYHLGAAKNLKNFVYVTVGTGIGAGALIDGKPLQGLSHPEMGHMSLKRVAGDEQFVSDCGFHSHCAEGLASGSAISKRWGHALNNLPADHPAWDVEAEYLAEFSHTLIVTLSPQRIIFGGGVSSEVLLAKVRDKLFGRLHGYVSQLRERQALDSYLCLPMLGGKAGPLGSFLLVAK